MLITLLLHVALTVPPSFSPAVARIAVAEAADIWMPYGVSIDLAGPCGWASDQSTVLNLVEAQSRGAAPHAPGPSRPGWHGSLGAVTFAPDGAPVPVITVFMTDLVQFISGTTVLGAAEWQWPRGLHDLVVGRVVGRVLAHELGHVLLRMPQHTARGLMRAVQRADELVEPSRRSFTLSADETARVR